MRNVVTTVDILCLTYYNIRHNLNESSEFQKNLSIRINRDLCFHVFYFYVHQHNAIFFFLVITLIYILYYIEINCCIRVIYEFYHFKRIKYKNLRNLIKRTNQSDIDWLKILIINVYWHHHLFVSFPRIPN